MLVDAIRVTIFYSDHNPLHFHAEYASHKVLVDIQGRCVIREALPFRQLKLILTWRELHRDELMQNGELSKDAKPLHTELEKSYADMTAGRTKPAKEVFASIRKVCGLNYEAQIVGDVF